MKKVLSLTGIRSDYDLMVPVYKSINQHPNLDLVLAVSGAHLSENHGYTLEMIMKDGFVIADTFLSLFSSDSMASRVKGLGVQVLGLVQTIEREKPDLLLVLGDREESLVVALIGAYMNIPVAHVAGGDRVVGNVDDSVRHAVTKLAHIHFATNHESAERIARLGEQEFRIFNVGNPGLDRLVEEPMMTRSELETVLNFQLPENKPIIVLIQHVLSSEHKESYEQMKATLEAVARLGWPTVMTAPNSDAGSYRLRLAIDEFSYLPNLKVFDTLPRTVFANLLREASVLLGNSSAGILEAPLLKLPVVNVGNRQKGRLQAGNVLFVPHEADKIVEAVQFSISDIAFQKKLEALENPYGDGASGKRIASILADLEIDASLLVKDITY